jgi:toluene monooxygenase system protein A
MFEPVWSRLEERWREAGPGVEWHSHGTTPIGFCELCQLVLACGTPEENASVCLVRGEQKHIFCSEPCRWIFEQDVDRYANHKDVVKRILVGDAPANVLELVRRYFDLDAEVRGKDVTRGRYEWLQER